VRYTVRVELHDPPEPNYDALHREMELEGFRRWISAGEGADQEKLALPTAEYAIDSAEAPEETLTRARRGAAAAHTGKYAVLVTPVDGSRRFSGLSKWVDKLRLS
jgi:hypothetical protein